ncbi:MAG: hypothetical protein M1837_004346 [Sclerophora amabilis]|nr:MAG: hypothetical protein M1837_004346 [Sclerophora amabilis]
MADEIHPSSPRPSGEFTESTVLDTLVPFATDVDIEDELGNIHAQPDEHDSPLAGIKQRQLLFFGQFRLAVQVQTVVLLIHRLTDELTTIYIVLQTPYTEESVLRSYLSRLAINLEVHVLNARTPLPQSSENAPGPSGPLSRDLIFSSTVKEDEDPLMVVQASEDDAGQDGTGNILVVWKMPVVLHRPRIRITRPVITFTAKAHLRPAEKAPSTVRAEEYLPSQVPAAPNLLESFSSLPALAHVKPRLSALRISRVAPVSPVAKELLRPLKSGLQKHFATVPAVNARVRYTKLNTYTNNPTIVASLDFDVMPFINCDVRLEQVDLQLTMGTVESLNRTKDLELPILCKPLDKLTFLYRLGAGPDFDNHLHQIPNVRILRISILVTILVAEDCRPPIAMNWKSNVDFSVVLNPTFEGPRQTLQRGHRPPSLTAPSPSDGPPAPQPSEVVQSGVGTSIPSPRSFSDGAKHRPNSASLDKLGLTMTLTGPREVVVGEIFRWDIFLVNRSDRPRKLALVVLPKRRGGDAHKIHSRPHSTGSAGKQNGTADAVVDENIVYAMQRSSIVEPADIVSLSTEVRVGPLPPLSCHTTELRFLPLTTGVLQIEAVRVVDLSTQQAIDPLLHSTIFLVELVAVWRLITKFNGYYLDKPILTMMLTNAILGGIADTVAQSLSAMQKRKSRSGSIKYDFVSIEIHELDEKNAFRPSELMPTSKNTPPPFDFERLTRFMAFGFMVAPLQFKWFQFLSRAFPITMFSATAPALKRVAFDQLIFAPCSLAAFFTFMTVAEGGGKHAVIRKFQDVYLPALKANYILWPAVQILNFRVMPIQYQLVSK